MKNIKIVLLLLILAFTGTAQKLATIKHVQDGDSYSAVIGGAFVKLRLINADSPELANKYSGKGLQTYGDSAKDLAKYYLHKKTVKVKLYGNDQYGRTLAEVWVSVEGKQRSLSNLLIKNGYAWVNTDYIQNETLKRILLSKQEFAKKNKLGLWKYNSPIEPKEWRK